MPRRSSKPKGIYAGDPEALPMVEPVVETPPAKKPGIWLLTLWFLEVRDLRDDVAVHTGMYQSETKAVIASDEFIAHGFAFERNGVIYKIPAHRVLMATVRAG